MQLRPSPVHHDGLGSCLYALALRAIVLPCNRIRPMATAPTLCKETVNRDCAAKQAYTNSYLRLAFWLPVPSSPGCEHTQAQHGKHCPEQEKDDYRAHVVHADELVAVRALVPGHAAAHAWCERRRPSRPRCPARR
eukprot:2499828-Pleurochrysis_carterae.AAC.1